MPDELRVPRPYADSHFGIAQVLDSRRTIFDHDSLHDAVDIQRRSYRLLRYLAGEIAIGRLAAWDAHDASSAAHAAGLWIREHYDSLPFDARPCERSPTELERFARFFASYLTTSFDIVDDGVRGWVPVSVCRCELCRYLVAAPRLRTKRLMRADKQLARRLQVERVSAIMREEGLEPGSESELEERWIRLEFSRDIALVTYGHELLRRCAGEPSGPEVLALWRSFAWTTSGSRVAGFQLSADAILEADRRVREAVHAGYPCACCGTPNLSEAGHGTYEICDVYGWEDDPVQFADPDRRGGANKESLREAREHYRRES